ncbi:hypothetical protein [Ekhidna sp.]
MTWKFRFFLIILIPVASFSQSPEEDKVKLKSALDWLDSKLNYIYYDNVGEQWWNNTFYVNENNEVTIKHIVSKRPNTANIKDKTYTIRRFRIQDINPNSLKITDIKETRGRIVKGQMLELRTYSFQEAIHKTINNRRASSTSFLFLSFPESLIDSVSNYAEIVKSKLHEAITASTQIYASDHETDSKTIINILNGSFKSVGGAEWKATKVSQYVLKVEYKDERLEYFGYDPNEKNFYLINISDKGVIEKRFLLGSERQIKISSDNTNETFTFETPNSFVYNGETYFRE